MSDEIEVQPKPMLPLRQGEKDRAITRMACLKAAAETVRSELAFRPDEESLDIAQYVIEVAERYEGWVYRDLALPPPPPREFDPGKDMLPGAITGKEMPKRLGEAMKAIDPTLDWRGLIGQIEGDRNEDYWRRLSNAIQKLSANEGGVITPEPPAVVEAFAWAFNGQAVQPDYLDAPEAPLAGVPIPPVDESIQFGKEK